MLVRGTDRQARATPTRPTVVVDGMHGLGDSIHQRAVMRKLMARRDVWLVSSWPSVYHDLIAQGLKVINRPVRLRTQTKNAKREFDRFTKDTPPAGAPMLSITYRPDAVRARGSVLAAMCAAAGVDFAGADFRLPIPTEWDHQARTIKVPHPVRKPLMILRPLHERREWGGCRTRNADPAAYAALYAAIRERFFVVSIADLEPGEEWLTEPRLRADVELHAGELTFEAMAALFARAALVFTSGGFAVILAQAVGTPAICVGGGYERCSVSYSAGARFAPCLFVEPIAPCDCFRHDCACSKAIDLAVQLPRVDIAARAAIAIKGA